MRKRDKLSSLQLSLSLSLDFARFLNATTTATTHDDNNSNNNNKSALAVQQALFLPFFFLFTRI